MNPNLKNSSQDINVTSATPSAMLSNVSSTGVAHSAWIPDLGASFHVIGEPHNIHQLGHFEGLDQIFIGNGQGLHINGSGSSSFLSPINSHVCFRLNNLLHVPSITKNLLSVSKFAKDNYVFFEFHPHHCLVKSQGTHETLLQGVVGVDGLYSFPNLNLQESFVLLSSAAKSPSSSADLSSRSRVVFNSSDVNKVSNVSLTPSSHT